MQIGESWGKLGAQFFYTSVILWRIYFQTRTPTWDRLPNLQGSVWNENAETLVQKSIKNFMKATAEHSVPHRALLRARPGTTAQVTSRKPALHPQQIWDGGQLRAGSGLLVIVCQSLVYRIKFILLNLVFKSLSSAANSPPQSSLVLFPMDSSQSIILELNPEQRFSTSMGQGNALSWGLSCAPQAVRASLATTH